LKLNLASSYGGNSAQYSDDGSRIVFASGRGGTWELWICSSEGVNCFQLTSIGFAGSPRFSPDGQYVAFDSGKYGSWDILVVNGAGGPARRLTGQVCAIDYFDLTKRSVSRIRTLPALNVTALLGAGPDFAVSPDERSFLYGAVERNEKDLMLLENFR
jgi:WD40-like Beta Propeller Repeat